MARPIQGFAALRHQSLRKPLPSRPTNRHLAPMRLALALLLLLATPAHAQPAGDCSDPNLPSTSLVRELTEWIGNQTGYDITRALAHPPTISFCKAGSDILYEGQTRLVDPDIRAAFDLPDRHIFLVLPWHASNPRDVSALLHELIHDIQLMNRPWPCFGAPEWQAYKLQQAWLATRGITADFNWLYIYMISRCPRDIHPD